MGVVAKSDDQAATDAVLSLDGLVAIGEATQSIGESSESIEYAAWQLGRVRGFGTAAEMLLTALAAVNDAGREVERLQEARAKT
jgi:hypothetical protein